MILGTASHVGKSLLTAGLGRIFSDDGIRVTPFKAQNMSLNSASTPDGREIGRAQALQAEACRAVPCAEMNPVLIKPTSDTGSQVILLGRVWGQVTAADYFRGRVEELFPAVLASYQKLAETHDLILLEGAGSPAEINLRQHDIVNMRMAHAAEAGCLLVGDIDRGGVFASLLGTIELLEPEDRARIRGFIINKFRGDITLLHSGVEMMEQRLGIPCAGIVPFLRDVGLEEEDSVAMEDRRTASRVWRNGQTDQLRIGVVALPHMANFTDFDALTAEPSVSLAFLKEASDASSAHIIILPGTKQTLDDMQWLSNHGFAAFLRSFSGMVIGICGGFQMLGTSIEDPLGVESAGVSRSVPGLGLLGIHTVMQGEKTVRQVTGHGVAWGGPRFSGYEIHMGETCYAAGTQPFATIGTEFDGAAKAPVFGTYVHGLFDNDAFRHNFLEMARERCGLKAAASYANVSAQRQSRLDRWADHLRESLNMTLIRGWASGR
jgi:adenosylcobyric acid synthase